MPAKARSGRHHRHVRIEAQEIEIGLVGVEHAAARVGDQRSLRQIVDEGLGDVVAGVCLPEMQNADGAGEEAEDADHGKDGKDAKHEGLGHFARHDGERHGRDGQSKRKHHDKTDAALRPLRSATGSA